MPLFSARPALLDSPVKQGRAQFLPSHVVVVLGLHVLALLAALPWIFSWTGVVLCIVGLYVFGTLGITIGYWPIARSRHRDGLSMFWLRWA
jgi:fatty-acid desaturase